MRVFYLLLAVLALVTGGCRELVTLELPQQEPRLVIEAELTDTPGPHTVRLTLTQDYFSKAAAPVVEDARVSITDDAGNSQELLYTQNGVYATQGLEGVIGRSYTLRVEWQGQVYESSGVLSLKPVIDSLVVQYFEAIPPFLDAGHYMLFYGHIPRGGTRYYRFKIYENDSLYNDRTDLLVPEAEFMPDTLREVRLGYAFTPGDTIRLEMYALNRDMYDYYYELRTLLFNDGGLFSPPPRNPTSNIRNVSDPARPPLGYFQVASFATDTVIIGEETD
ncbi:DUF4249 domain-containing protein [Cesiribacter andamanensis]|uniref:DUF4249 domain-containing protein n=1 Tax=Cesiribacter andamanensis AMV16 TaxID=1279009 RepID=M7NV86_9BACT|nr:DUF4249 domain-containing protein [Cesiribacter andamanensis]EMR02369.1 hypothetical protein ADICEAN_02518 [Cesiribacter andamanensis AMV16]